EASGKICSVSKSKLFFSRNTPSETQRSISSLTNMPIVQDLGKYLGIPLLTKRNMVLPPTITQFIYAQPLPIHGSPDTLTNDHVWYHHTGVCSIRSTYRYLLSKPKEVIGRISVTWSWIWKLKIPPKIQSFLWKCAHHHIPTKLVIFPHADLSDQGCSHCNELETPIHVLHDYQFARNIWSSFPCKSNSKLHSPLGYVPWNLIFAFTLWAIWLGRNSLIFLGTFIPFHILKQNSISYATKWSLAPSPYITINTNDNSLGNPGKSGVRGVARSSNGE
ncbi:hypothetical protein CFP56_038651, partial [Quercus suber]